MFTEAEINDALIDMHAQDYLMAKLDGVILSTGQIESLLGTEAFEAVLWSVTDRGRAAAESGVL